MKAKRVFLIVLDSFGIGELPDAACYGDAGCDTMRSVSGSGRFHAPNLRRMGLFNIDGLDAEVAGKATACPVADYARLAERSAGKDTTIGHWELTGVISEKPLPLYPNGFPPRVIERFERETGRRVICNKPYSGTRVLLDYGREQIKTGALIVYTSADSVFQVAGHETYIGLDFLYKCCEVARKILTGQDGVGRVIARPYVGEYPDFKRTANRRDYSLAPPAKTVLDELFEAGRDVIGVGKISDIFSGRGVTRSFKTKDNVGGMEKTIELLGEEFNGLCFVNLVDFDMVYGHRNDVDGYAGAVSAFDEALGIMLERLREDDVLMITADHGCDPGAPGTDHTREYVPLLVYAPGRDCGRNLGTPGGLDVVAERVREMLL